jgi:hypothetical protein
LLFLPEVSIFPDKSIGGWLAVSSHAAIHFRYVASVALEKVL